MGWGTVTGEHFVALNPPLLSTGQASGPPAGGTAILGEALYDQAGNLLIPTNTGGWGNTPLDAAILADNPSAFWKLADPAGLGVAVDSSGSGLHAQASGGVTSGVAGQVSDGETATTF